MTEEPLVTIGLASYNNAPYILETLKSIAAQTYRNFELIIVDDCSTDNSPGIIREFLGNCSVPSKLIIHEENKGVVAVCNRLLDEARGSYYSIISSDDLFFPEKTKIQAAVMSVEACDMVFSNVNYIGTKGETVTQTPVNRLPSKSGPFNLTWAFLLGGSFIPAPTVLLRTETVRKCGGYSRDFGIEDMPLWISLAQAGARMHYIDMPLVKYRLHGASLGMKLSTLVTHARIVSRASKALQPGDRRSVRRYMWSRIVSTNDSSSSMPPIPAAERLFWICLVNRTRIGHYLLYKMLARLTRTGSFQRVMETIRSQRIVDVQSGKHNSSQKTTDR